MPTPVPTACFHKPPRLRLRTLAKMLGAIAVLGTWSTASHAISRIIIEVEQITAPGTEVAGARATLDLTHRAPVAIVRADRVETPEPVGPLRDVKLECTTLHIREPEFSCRAGKFAATGGPTKDIKLDVAATYDTQRQTANISGSGLALAGGEARFSGVIDPRGWTVEGHADALDIVQVRALISPWLAVPADLDFTGHVEVTGQAASRGAGLQVAANLATQDFNFTNTAGTVVAENLTTTVEATATQAGGDLELQMQLEGTKGQALAGPVLVDLGANPAAVTARGQLSGDTLSINDLTLTQTGLSQARGQARVVLGETPRLAQAHVDLANLEFPAAYTTFMQIALAATDFGQLKTSGSARGTLDINDDAITQIVLHVSGLTIEDEKNELTMDGVNADLHWARDASTKVTPSRISWNSASAYGLSGGATHMEFTTHGAGFELTGPARLPLFDGAVLINALTTRHLGAPDAELDFDATIEPISMKLVSRAFGWPELNGQLSGSVPGLTYRNGVLRIDGDLVASVFDGMIVGRSFRLENPLGPWPRLHADVTARRLDLSLVTSTFEIGSITGRLDADVLGLELFDWSPVAFDARLYSTPGDKSKKLISAKAVTSISNVGGGGGGVTAALQSGFLRFFDDYRYDRIGIACRLENNVCTMSGIEPAGMGYYLVKGRGLPRIDIIGNQGRVAWPQLLSQIQASIQSEGAIVR